ncbi:MAG: PAS domain S-box protein [Chloroflexota bacterium]
MAEATSLAFILLALALWWINDARHPMRAQFFALIVEGLALFSLAGYLFEVPTLYAFFRFSAISFPTALGLLFAGFSVLLVRPHSGWMSVISGDNVGGIMARRLLPAALLIPLIVGWVRLKGQQLGIYGTEFGLALFALANIITFLPLLWWNARLLNDVDTERRQAIERARKLNRTLAVLSDVNQAIVRIRHIPTLYERVCQIAVETGEFRIIWIGLIDPVTQKLALAAHAGVSSGYQESLKRAINDDTRMQKLVADLNQAINHVVYNDLQTESSFSPEQRADMAQFNYRSLALLPLRISGELRGVIDLGAFEPNFFDADELKLLDELAGDIAFAIEFAEQEVLRHETEAIVLETESRYRRLFDNLLEGAEIIGFDWRYLYANDASSSHGRQPKDVLLRSTVLDLYPGIENTEMFGRLRICMEERIAQHIETEFFSPDGTATWFELSVEPIPEGIFILSLDITERKRTETILKRYSERMEILHEIDSSLIEGDSIQSLVETTLKHLRKIIPCQRASVILLDEKTGEGVIFANDMDGETELKQGLRVPATVDSFEGYDTRHLRVFDDIRPLRETMPRAKQFVDEGLVSSLNVLLMDQDRPIGSLGLLANTPAFFTSDYQEIAAEISNQLAIAIRHLRLTEDILQYTADLGVSIRATEEISQFLQTTLDAFSADVAVLDPDGTIINVNAAWRYFSVANGSVSSSAYLNTNYLEICDLASGSMSAEAAPAAAGIRSVIAGEQDEFYLEYPCHSSWQKRWFGMSVTPFPEPAPRRVVVAHVGITERKKAEFALQEANETLEQRVLDRTFELNYTKERVEAILNNSTDGILLMDADLRIRQTNPAFDTLFRTKLAEIGYDHLLDFIHPNDTSRIVELIQVVIAGRIGKRIELIGVRTDGTLFDADFSIGYFAEEHGREGFVCTVQDITERKRSDEALHDSEERFRSLLQAAPLATVITDQAGTIILVNQQSEILFGYTGAELIGQPVEMLLPQDAREQHTRHRAGFVAEPRRRPMGQGMELFAHRKEGTELPVEINLSYVETDSGLLIIAFIVDITERKERERQLRFYASLQESVSDAVISTDLQFRIQSWNPAAERIYGWRAEEVLGKNINELLPTQFPSQETIEQVQDDFLKKGYWIGEASQYHRDGQIIHILSSMVLFKDENSHPFGIVSVNHDITERKHVEEAVRESEARYRLLADAINDVVIRFTPSFDYLYVSPSSRTILGYEPEELLGRSDFQRIHPDDIQAIRDLVTKLVEHPDSATITYRFRHKQGHYVWLESMGRAVVSEQTGEVVEFIFSLRDVTKRMQVEEVVRESEARYRMLADNIADLVTRVDTSGNYVYVSPSSRTVLGYKPEALIGTSAFDLIHPDDASNLIAVQSALQAPNFIAAPTTYRSRHKDGHYVWFETSGQIIWSEDKTEMLGFITVSRDISERKRTAEALALSEQRFSFLVNSISDYAIYMLDPQGNVASWNSGAENIKGYSAEEILGQSFERFYTAEAIAQGQPQAILRIAQDIRDIT